MLTHAHTHSDGGGDKDAGGGDVLQIREHGDNGCHVNLPKHQPLQVGQDVCTVEQP